MGGETQQDSHARNNKAVGRPEDECSRSQAYFRDDEEALGGTQEKSREDSIAHFQQTLSPPILSALTGRTRARALATQGWGEPRPVSPDATLPRLDGYRE